MENKPRHETLDAAQGTTQGATQLEAQNSTQAHASADPFLPYTRGGNWPPVPPKGRMPLEQRAKIFIPFEPLKGFNEAIRKKEQELEAAHPDMNPLTQT